MIAEESTPAIDIQALAFSAEGLAVLRGEASRLSRYLGSGLDKDDLLQAGRLGLLQAAERYEPRRGRFATYARWWVLCEMGKVIHHSRSPVRIPASVRSQLRQCCELTRQGTTTARLAAELGVSERMALTLQMLVSEGGEAGADSEQLPDPGSVGEAELLGAIEQERLLVLLRQETPRLPERERMILTRLYGLDGEPRQTMRQLGKQMGLSHQRVQQLQKQALERLRKRIKGQRPRRAHAA